MSSARVQKNLILSAVAGYGVKELTLFVDSWRRHVPSADLVLIAGHLDASTLAWLEARGVGVVPGSFCLARADKGWRKAVRTEALRVGRRVFSAWIRCWGGGWPGRIERLEEALLDIMSSRFADFGRYLELFGPHYAQVLLTDCRDVFFQADPFPGERLEVYCENELIGDSHFARRWLQLTYGSSAFRALAGRPFICSGTTLGDVDAVRDYVWRQAAECARVMACAGADQAVHNVIIHRGEVEAKVRAFGEGAVITLNGIELSGVEVNANRVVDARGRPFPVVHQYDRVKGLAEILQRQLEPMP